MKKNLLTLAMLACAAGAYAYWLPTPVITSEKRGDGKVDITWDYDTEHEDARLSHFVVTVYKMHRATADENFILAATDFDYIESKGTMKKSEERGANWDQVFSCPGWWVRFPKYMEKAMGIDAFMYFQGSGDMDTAFIGAYMMSPDYDLSNVTEKKLNVKAQLGNEANSVTGGFATWAWNTNWVDPTNVDYKPVWGMDSHYDVLSNANWKDFSETLYFPNVEDYTDPDDIDEVNGIDHSRVRLEFYGTGYSTYWVNSFEVSVDLKSGDSVDYGASAVRLDPDARSFSIDTTDDTETDYVYAYEVRAVNEEWDDYRELNAVRATSNPYEAPRYKIGDFAGVECIGDVEAGNVKVEAGAGYVSVSGASEMQIYTTTGACVYNGGTDRAVNVGTGVFVVKAGGKATKVIM